MTDSGEEKTNKQSGPAAPSWRKLAIELGPLLVFFAAYYMWDIFVATSVFMVATAVSMIASWILTRHIPPMLWVSGVVVAVMGGLTIYLQDETFLKLKPTIVYMIFATILGFGLMRGRSYLKLLLEAAFPPLEDRGWMIMTRNWALFFVAMAVLNEAVWRNFSTDFWVNFKVFGAIPITMVFAISQTPVIQKYMIEESEKN